MTKHAYVDMLVKVALDVLDSKDLTPDERALAEEIYQAATKLEDKIESAK